MCVCVCVEYWLTFTCNLITRIRWILGYDPAEMVGLKVYQYLHPEDMSQETLSKCHANCKHFVVFFLFSSHFLELCKTYALLE